MKFFKNLIFVLLSLVSIKGESQIHGYNHYTTEAKDFFVRMAVLTDPVPVAPINYKALYNAVSVGIKVEKGYDATTSLQNSLDLLRIEDTYSKTAALENFISSSHRATITNDHGASFTAKVGITGNGTNFRVNCNYNPFDGGTYNYTVNNACIGVGVVGNDAGSGSVEMGAMNAGFTNGSFIRPKNISGNGFATDAALNDTPVTVGLNPTGLLTGINSIAKVGTGAHIFRTNGAEVKSITGSTNASVNTAFFEFCVSGNGTPNLFSSRTHDIIFAGSSNIYEAKILGIYIKYWKKPLNNATALYNKRIVFYGDSRTNHQATDPETGGSTTLSAFAGYQRTTLAGSPGWVGASNGKSNRTLATINTDQAIIVAPYACLLADKDVACVFALTNDMASAVQTAAVFKGRYDTFITNAFNAGFRTTIVIGEIDRRAFLSVSQAQFDAARNGVRTLMLAEYTQATSVTDVWKKPSEEKYYIDLFNNPIFQDATNVTYYQDLNHLTAAGNDVIANTYLIPLLLILDYTPDHTIRIRPLDETLYKMAA